MPSTRAARLGIAFTNTHALPQRCSLQANAHGDAQPDQLAREKGSAAQGVSWILPATVPSPEGQDRAFQDDACIWAAERPKLAVVTVWERCTPCEPRGWELALAGLHRSLGEQRLAGLQRLTMH